MEIMECWKSKGLSHLNLLMIQVVGGNDENDENDF